MCGITFVHRIDKERANKAIMKRYHHQKSRGSDGFGYVAIHNKKLKSYKRAKLESQIRTFIEKENADTILFHHRFPTSTPNIKESAHPIKVSSIDLKYDYYLTHNGIIENADDLKEKHEKLGFVYNTELTKKWITSGATYKNTMFNDSEALAIEVALAIDTNSLEIEAEGSIAFIVAQVHKSTNAVKAIYYARNNGNPLKFYQDKLLISVGSESEGKLIDPYKLYRLDLKTSKITEQKLDIPAYMYASYTNYGSGAGITGFRTSNDDDTDYNDTRKKDDKGWSGDDDYDFSDFGYGKRKTQLLDLGTISNPSRRLEALQDKWYEVQKEIEETENILSQIQDRITVDNDMENEVIEGEAILDTLYAQLDELEQDINQESLICF